MAREQGGEMELLESVKKATLSVLSKTPENELKVITLPILREKVANVMSVSIEEFLGKDIKLAIMETFQEFLLNQSENEKTESVSKKSKISETKKTVEPVAKKQADKSKEPSKKTENSSQSNKSEKPKNSSSPVKSSSKSAQIEKLKSYVFKCGVRKNWKKELEGLNENKSIAKIQEILKELGIEGKPSLEQCKAIKKRREFEAELKEIDTSNIIEGKRRRTGANIDTIKRKLIISDDSQDSEESEEESDESDVESTDESEVDLKALGDSESESDSD